MSFIDVFQILKMQNFGLEKRRMVNAHEPFCWWMSFTKVSNPFQPLSPKDHQTYVQETDSDWSIVSKAF